ncbi:MAG: hypothetical protein ABL998_19415, partial [Planctomycetota bacterium]
MSLRVVVYAEGPRELGPLPNAHAGGPTAFNASLPPLRTPPKAGDPVLDDELGPAHDLCARCLEYVRRVPRAAIRFEHGLLKSNAHVPRGSDLAHPRTLRTLLTWARAEKAPDLAVVLVDEDDQKERVTELRTLMAERAPTPKAVVAVCRQEFEAWLLADQACVLRELGKARPDGNVEAWQPRQAKLALEELLKA